MDEPPGLKIHKEPRVKIIIKPNLSHETIFLEADDHKPVDFNGETISTTSQLSKI